MKATQLLTQHHRHFRVLLKNLLIAKPDARRALFEDFATRLAAHDAIERQIFYPALEIEMGMTPILGESLVEHGVIEFMLYRADRSLDSAEFPFEAKVLSETVLHHAGEEEAFLFPDVENALTTARLEELGEAMEFLYEEALEKDFRIAVHSQLQQVLRGGMKTQDKAPRSGSGQYQVAKVRAAGRF
jgi:hemerythrin superfamily protein